MSTKQQRPASRVFWPRFLLASPHLRGTAYDRQVVYLIEHTAARAVGLLLDSGCQRKLRELRDALVHDPARRLRRSNLVASLPVQVVQWVAGQLDQELRYGVWLNGPAEFERLLADCEDLWVELVRDIGQSVLRDALRLSELPAEPWRN